MKDLEEYYRNILGNPLHGDINDLEKKFSIKAEQLRNIKENKEVHLSAIQQNGEIIAAYQFLKTLWGMNFRNKKNEASKKIESVPVCHLSFGERIYKRLKILTRAAVISLGIMAIFQLILFFSSLLNVVPEIESQEVILAKAIQEESTFRSFRSRMRNQEDSLYLNKIPMEPNAQPELIKAARSCNINQMKKAIQDGESANIVNQKGETGLHWVVKRNCIDGVKFLLSKGARINIQDSSGRTPADLAESSYNFTISNLFKSASS